MKQNVSGPFCGDANHNVNRPSLCFYCIHTYSSYMTRQISFQMLCFTRHGYKHALEFILFFIRAYSTLDMALLEDNFGPIRSVPDFSNPCE